MDPNWGESHNDLSSFLEDAIAAAETRLREMVRPEDISLLSAVSEDLVRSRIGIASSGGNIPYVGIKERFPGAEGERIFADFEALLEDPSLWPDAIRFAVELILVERGVDRAEAALQRYSRFRAAVTARRMPDRAREYVDDVVDAYLFGFDSAAIALACSCFEQLAKHTLIAVGLATEGEFQRNRATAESLRRRLVRAGLLDKSASEATKLVLQRNHVMHTGMFDYKIRIEEISLDCLKALIAICRELEPSWPRDDYRFRSVEGGS